jgi:hypothetical protein
MIPHLPLWLLRIFVWALHGYPQMLKLFVLISYDFGKAFHREAWRIHKCLRKEISPFIQPME